MTGSPIIFLDFDGVIVTRESSKLGHYTDGMHRQIDDVRVRRLSGICEATGAVVVISSTWRLGRYGDVLSRWLRAKGLAAEVIGSTPQIHATESGSGAYFTSPRGAEILAWLWSAARSGRDVSRYVILDDESDAGFGHTGRFVRCGLDEGLTEAAADEAIRILMGDAP